MPSLVIVDSGPLIATFQTFDPAHVACSQLFRRNDVQFVIPALCIAESAHLLSSRGSWQQEVRFLKSLAELDIRLPEPEDWDVIADVIARYSDFDLGVVDASVVVLAQRLGADTIATLDHRHFRAIRPSHVPAFTLVP